jgi:hypothetical protein
MLGSQVWAKCRPVRAAALVVGLLAVGSGPREAVMPRGLAGGPCPLKGTWGSKEESPCSA